LTAPITRDAVDDFGLVGALFRPADGMVSAGVVVLGGSEGGMHERDAHLLAGHGFTALALAYFGATGIPPVLKDIPLEYFSRAIDLLEHRGIRAGAIGLLGGSRGGEAALLVASHDDRIGAVVSVAGSGVVTEGIDFRLGRLDCILREPTSAWTLNGQPLRSLPHVVSDDFADRIARGGIVALRDAYPELPAEPSELNEVSIPVERIRGAVLLLSASDDQMWVSAGFSQVAADRLRAHRHPYP
jgi:dienelactone hydrolase